MRYELIETVAKDVHKQIWRKRGGIWPAGISPMDMLDPRVAAELFGVNFEYQPDLGRFGQGQDKFEVAGALDRPNARIVISTKFHADTVRFTAAHELGHWLLHDFVVPHRDRPIKGLSSDQYRRSVEEREADYFAACFLMPPNLLRKVFEAVFNTKCPFIFNFDNSLMLSGGNDPEALLYPDQGSLVRELTLANARSYQGRHFTSLAKHFRVSDYSMAIRLRELRLVQD